MNMPRLSIEKLSVSFVDEKGWRRVVSDVSFQLMPGQSLGIVGESGSGKSVTSLSVMRLLPAKESRIGEGRIVFTDESGAVFNITELRDASMRKLRGSRIAMIFQEPMSSLNPVMKCGKQLTESIQLHLGYSRKKAKTHALSLFTEVQLPEPDRVFNAYPHQLSGGQKQRVMIAMAIACKPAVLIADEPTTALDVTVQKAILALLRSLQRKYGMSLLFISHDLGVIADVADYVVVMKQGKIVEQGRVETVFADPQHAYTKGLMACRPPVDRRLNRLPVVSDFTGAVGQPDAVLPGRFFAIDPEVRRERHRLLYSADPLLRVENLSVHYTRAGSVFSRNRQNFKAVDALSFEVFRGETLGLVGESGCGKTTLGRALLRLIEPSGGKIFFDGADVRILSQEALRNLRKRVQIIFQDPYASLNPRITAGQAVLEPMQAHHLYGGRNERKEKVIELLEQVNLQADHFNRYPHQFSGGQRQRICIARTLALNPEFIICDESVSALDVSVQAQVLNLLNDLKQKYGFTYIFISHDLSVVRFMSDRMLVMRKGRMVESGEADSVYEHPAEMYTRELISAVPGAGLRQVH